MNNMSDLEALKFNDPVKYKAASMASVVSSTMDPEKIPSLIEKLYNHLLSQKDRIIDGQLNMSVTLSEDSISKGNEIVELSNSLENETIDPLEVTSRLKSLIIFNLTNLKDNLNKLENEGEDQFAELSVWYYDQILILNDLSKLADNQ